MYCTVLQFTLFFHPEGATFPFFFMENPKIYFQTYFQKMGLIFKLL